ncbi:hypothetical protein JYT81_00275 [Gammaproteobacteria bacterium AH-315-K14]|nr:hypothetical protein [Gammaproteobacteria bacterium AH-315-K14]MBN4053002.1 hypothetical protein [Gammaproteobacteria bacterium AH-315-K14]
MFFCSSIFFLTSCAYISQGPWPDADRGAIATSNDVFGDTVETIVYPDQNWGRSDSMWYYNTTQGSDLLPYDVYLHLEQADSSALFRDIDNMLRFRYLPQRPTWDNPDGLPVGWTKDSHDGEDYIGFTCAACHTSQVNFQSKGIRIDGGPALADMETMLVSLSKAVNASLRGEKFIQLAKNVLDTDSPTQEQLKSFKELLTRFDHKIAEYVRVNEPKHESQDKLVHYGYGRLDAFGRIYNRVLMHVTEDAKTNPANAPVSYPFLWDTPQHDFVQWNGVGDNGSALGLGPLGRNTGEVLGVFATLKVTQNASGKVSYHSSAESGNQVRLESRLEDLWSPSWEELSERGVLPEINAERAAVGKKVYTEYQCDTCHAEIDRTDSSRIVVAQFASVDWIGTDPQMASNAIRYCGEVGVLKNVTTGMCPSDLHDVNTSSVLPILSDVTAGAMTEGIFRKLGLFFTSIYTNPLGFFRANHKTQRHVELEISNKSYLNAYKGRPLNGIWATAPYLHNGSVPNLYELLLPSCTDREIQQGKQCRSKTFSVGNRELDVKNVGYVQLNNPEQFTNPPLFIFDTTLPSNSNKGHEYAAGNTPMPKVVDGKVVRDEKGQIVKHKFEPMNHTQRIALVEYLKTL